MGLSSRRILIPESINSRRRMLALMDIVHQSPEIAVEAFRGCALSSDAEARRDAAMALRDFYESFPLEATQLAMELVGDTDEIVNRNAFFACRMISQREWEPPHR